MFWYLFLTKCLSELETVGLPIKNVFSISINRTWSETNLVNFKRMKRDRIVKHDNDLQKKKSENISLKRFSKDIYITRKTNENVDPCAFCHSYIKALISSSLHVLFANILLF